MATYKLIQDIEAEDKILGPLTLRQFIFAMIAAFLMWIDFFMVTKGAAFTLVIFLPVTIFFAFFALPLGRDQPTEVWALAKLRYFFKPRRRVWNQSGVKELVTITAPKKTERVLTKGLTETEVHSRLRALADTIDTRGWAVKNVNVNAFATPIMISDDSDRLVGADSLPHEVTDANITAADDMLDETSNPIAQQFDSLIDESTKLHRQELVDRMKSEGATPSPRNDYWFMGGTAVDQSTTMPVPEATKLDPAEEAAVVSQLKAKAASHPAPYGHLRTVKPLGKGVPKAAARPPAAVPPPMTAPADPAILSLAENDDLNVSTLAREAKRAKGDDEGEVVVPLR